ncbi:LCP family protein [Nocardioides sp. SYSU D00038]|uniref:LCP family protein n=1 Tax=Nocardioides sp. SYSU D00038 TaxID=2812554 RepID=UPI0027DB9097|nr:LCP family protein [Nocardioides sp. SYSU D00038]
MTHHGSRSNPQDRAARIRFRRALALMLMTLVLPGSAQVAAGNPRVGRIAIRTWFVLVGLLLVGVLVALVSRDSVFAMASDTTLLQAVRLVLIGLAIGWAVLFMDAWRLGQPLSLALGHRRAIVGVNGVLCLTVASVLLFGAHLVGVQRTFIQATFGATDVSDSADGRYNVLLLGGDSGADRWGLRPDSLTVASIDARTGRTVLIGLPRNLEDFPFRRGSVMAEQFPDGFDCDGCYLNGVSTWAQDNAELFPGSDNPGVDATVMAVEGITKLDISYWAMVNLRGFEDLVDAVGGVTLTVRQPIPVGGLGSDVTGYIEPGRRKLDGAETLWFARAREGSDDYSRMARQKCVMSAMLDQVSPQVALRNFKEIAEASSAMISTNLPASELDRFMSLALKAKAQRIASVSLVPPLIDTADPDVRLMRRTVAEAIAKAEGEAPAPRKAGKPRPDTVVTGGSLGSRDEGYAANHAEDLASAC